MANHRGGLLSGVFAVFCLVFGAGPGQARADGLARSLDGPVVLVCPVAGGDRNELTLRGARGAPLKKIDTAPEYGLCVVVAHPRFVLNDFLFLSRVNDTDVSGNLLFLNVYGDRKAVVTWDLGGGYLYHRIQPENEDIRVNVPLAKAGPLFRIERLRLSLNPYLGYAWERIDTRRGDVDNDSYLFGLAAVWRWRMLEASVNYYYQHSLGLDDDYQTVHARLSWFLSRNWGFVTRLDSMEHPTTRDTSVLAGPAYVF